MRSQRLGCLTPIGLIAGLVTLLVIGGITAAQGGILFSPGGLSAFSGPVLGGVSSHAELGGQCEACHVSPWSPESMTNRCLDCHTQMQTDLADPTTLHGGLIDVPEQVDCRACHTEHHGPNAMLTRLDVENFPHAVTGFSLLAHGKHPNGDLFVCGDCHGSSLAKLDPSVCTDCHQKIDRVYMQDHTAAFGISCLDCHDGIDLYSNFDHNQTQFVLNGMHAETACQDCHRGSTTIQMLEQTPNDCVACHRDDDAHGSQLGTDCAECHTSDAWKPANFDHNLRTEFVLDGEHVDVACSACHQNNTFKGTPGDCVSCHQPDDPHEGQLGPDCAACHTTNGWQPANFDHNTQTGFVLAGMHVDVACSACHQNNTFKGTPDNCVSCHQPDDPHEGQLGADCSTCHTPEGWKPANFDHNTQTSFALAGLHLQASCSDCHANNTFAGTPVDCVACHKADDTHQGSLGSKCAECHSPEGWKPANFDHNTRTKFTLVGQHQQAACSTCHANNRFAGTPASCVACHQSDDTHKGTFGTDCASCHNPNGWKPAAFDHGRSNFPLTGKHVSVTCTVCHQNAVFRGTPTNCVACHSSDDAHNGQLGSDCAACHSTSGWKPATFDHSRSNFPLTGAHQNAACQSCHAGHTYRGTPTSCVACHAQDDRHNGQFGTDCAACHNTSRWGDVTFNHANTSFPLTGAHSGLPCLQCHANARYQGTPTECSACHTDPTFHAGIFGANCSICHNTSRWVPATYNGPHTFPMGHGKADTCRDCHPSSLGSWTCYTCHDQAKMTKKHTEKGIADFSNCLRCHPDGRKGEDGDGGGGGGDD